MRILILRHGEPDYDRDCLTERGWAQAEALRNDYLQKNPLALVLSGAWAASVGGGGGDGGAYSGGGGSSAASAGTKEQTKLAANQKGSGSGKKRRL